VKVGVLLAVSTLATVAAAAPTKRECVDADTWGQSHRQEGKLHAARADFRKCLDPACPAIVRADCRMRLEDVDRVMPSVVIEAPVDLATAKVTMDGAPLTVGSEPIDVDPGPHHFVLRVPGRAPVERDLVVAEGYRGRRVVFERPTAEVAPAPQRKASAGIGPLRIAGIVTGALGLVGIGFGAGFGVAAYGAWSTVESECFQSAPCDVPSAVADRQRTLDLATASDVAFVVGGVLAAGGLALVLFGGHVAPTVTREGVGLAFARTF
jgi:hypothetical protein